MIQYLFTDVVSMGPPNTEAMLRKTLALGADEVASTSSILHCGRRDDVQEVIAGTEMGILHRLQNENPEQEFFLVSAKATCPNMKRITLEKVLHSLGQMKPEIKVPEDIRLKAKASVDQMLEM